MDNSSNIRRARPLLGTIVEIGAGARRGVDVEAAIEQAFAAVAEVHRLMSFHDADSDVGRLNREAAARAVTVHPLTYAVLETAVELNRRSRGIFDISVAPVLQRMGLLPGDDLQLLACDGQRGEVIDLLPGSRVRFASHVAIDLGGIAKGFAVDRAIAVLRENGVVRGVVNAGGDLAAFGTPVAAEVRDPRDAGRTLCGVTLNDDALASSGARFDPLRSAEPSGSAVIDPATQRAADGIVGATVRAGSCMIADALTKVVMISPEAASPILDRFRARALMVAANGMMLATADWQVERAA